MVYSYHLGQQGLTDLSSLTDQQVRDYVGSTPLTLLRGKYPVHESLAARSAPRILCYLRSVGVVPPVLSPPMPLWVPLLDEWLSFLRQHRGLTEGTLAGRRYCVGRFLASLGADATPDRLKNVTPENVRSFLRTEAVRNARSQCKSLVSMLRLFLGFALDRGYLRQDLRLTIEGVPSFRHDRLPRGPRWEDALKLLTTADRATVEGRRDYAVLLLFLSYGVRLSQVTLLTLDDILWRSRLIRFRPVKRGQSIEVPLLPAVGDALLDYIRCGRPQTRERRIFFRLLAPVRPLGPGAITHIVERAFRLSGVRTPHWGSHSLRHAWATQMLREGRSLKAIADLLGHRELDSTQIYAKVDFRKLAEVPLPWPVTVPSEEANP
jgi:integrase/recombinase XerD